jgi:hypothetical protein
MFTFHTFSYQVKVLAVIGRFRVDKRPSRAGLGRWAKYRACLCWRVSAVSLHPLFVLDGDE